MSQETESKKGAIVKSEGRPLEPDRPGEVSRWSHFKRRLLARLKWGGGLSEAYADARVAKERNEAQKLAEEAAKIAAQTDAERQEAYRRFAENVDELFTGSPDDAEALKLMKLLEANPGLKEQAEKVQALLGWLRDHRETRVEILDIRTLDETPALSDQESDATEEVDEAEPVPASESTTEDPPQRGIQYAHVRTRQELERMRHTLALSLREMSREQVIDSRSAQHHAASLTESQTRAIKVAAELTQRFGRDPAWGQCVARFSGIANDISETIQALTDGSAAYADRFTRAIGVLHALTDRIDRIRKDLDRASG